MCFQLGAFILLAALPSLAQMDGRSRVTLQLTVMLEGERMPTQEQLTITVMDGWGNVVIAQDTRSGFVQFEVSAGLHRLT
ncbi:MAG TPA: hypothetical protein VJA94_21505, partial [Candidatus Angelobacter sp.]